MVIREIRKRLDLTLDEFSKMLGISLVSAARYESSRPPRGKQLARVAEKVATIPGCAKEAAILQYALSAELGTWTAGKIQLDQEWLSNTDKLWHASLARALHDPKHAHILPVLAKALSEPAKDAIAELEETHASKKVAAEINRLLKLGARPLAVAEDQGVPFEAVEAIQQLNQFTASLRELQSQKRVEARERALERLRKFGDSLIAAKPNISEEEFKKRLHEFRITMREEDLLEPISSKAELDLLMRAEIEKKGRRS